MKHFSVIMPTYNQATFIRRAIQSLINQTYTHWELIIINDGCTDHTEDYIRDFLDDHRISYLKNTENKGLGYAINQGIDKAKYDFIAYLPSDDYYYENHLELLKNEFERSEEVVLVYATAVSAIKDSILNNVKTTINGLFNAYSLQLVQTAHKKTPDRWTTRKEWVTNDLFDLFWRKLTDKGKFASVKNITCNWTSHPHQHHRLVNETYNGGLNIYRSYYQVKEPIKLKVSKQKFIDEEQIYKNYQTPKVSPSTDKPLKILIAGELSYNPERVFALEEQGHKLYGLWMNRPSYSNSTVGPLPFGHVTDIPYNNWEKKIREIQPDIIYALLDYDAVLLAYEVLKKELGIPFVWHYKEGPFYCLQSGVWDKLIELYRQADGRIYLNPEIKCWYEQFIPKEAGLSLIMDGDQPSINYFTDDFSERLSEQDGEIHTVIPGRPIGIELEYVKILVRNQIHIHLYLENYHHVSHPFVNFSLKIAPDHFHLHTHCTADQWVREYSKYDAGWLHCFDSRNNGKLEQAGWDDLNLPTRINTLAAAGLPMIQKRNRSHIVAMKSYIEKDNLGVFFDNVEELAATLKNKEYMQVIKDNVRKHRYTFSFDYHVNDLVDFFRKVIENKKSHG